MLRAGQFSLSRPNRIFVPDIVERYPDAFEQERVQTWEALEYWSAFRLEFFTPKTTSFLSISSFTQAPPLCYQTAMQEAKSLEVAGDDPRHQHAVLAEQMGFGNHAFVLPLIYSSLAGLSTGIGGLFVLCVRGNALVEVSVRRLRTKKQILLTFT